MNIIIINGPNLNLLGTREPEIYGTESFDSFFDKLKKEFSHVNLIYFQSNSEGEIIDKLHYFGFDYDAIILNAGAYTHTSIAIADAITSIKTPVIEVHISNTFARESYRQKSYITKNCSGLIVGFGLNSYKLAIQSIVT